ncbi:hypothetical protein [Halosimplex sp. TS25]|uniref:hypothetical protein n=1 Tax=Halosimplex rarum TaxID=3396619 RepID=UPI0039EA8BD0
MKYDETDPMVGRYEYVVRDVDQHDLGIQDWIPPESCLKTRGYGELKVAASDEIERRLDLEEHVGEHIATVWIDCDAWEYSIYWEVEPPINQRFRDLVRRLTGGDPA